MAAAVNSSGQVSNGTTTNTNSSTNTDDKDPGVNNSKNKNTTDDNESKENNSNNNNNSDEKTANDNNNNKNSNSKFLKWGILPHLELEHFYEDEEQVDKHCTPLTWSNCAGNKFDVRRGPNYVSGQKAPSGKALYRVFGIDTYKSPKKINKLSQFVDLNDRIESMSKKCKEYSYDKWPLPPIVIINVMIPNYSPPLLGDGATDGEGFSLVLYAELADGTRGELEKLYSGKIKKEELSPAIKLLSKFIHASESRDSNQNFKNNKEDVRRYGMKQKEIDDMLQRFKVIVRVMNYSKTQMPYAMHPIVTRYNAKPFLARTSSTFYHEPGKYFAIDIDAHIFGKLARKSLGYLRDCMETVIFDGAFVVEGQKDDELPEQVLCSARISKIGQKVAKEFPKQLLEEYQKRKKQNAHTNAVHDINSQSMMDLRKQEKKENDNMNENDKASKTVTVINRTDVNNQDSKNDKNDNKDSNTNTNASSEDTMGTVESNGTTNLSNGHAK